MLDAGGFIPDLPMVIMSLPLNDSAMPEKKVITR
jgi:hypothetical protein